MQPVPSEGEISSLRFAPIEMTGMGVAFLSFAPPKGETTHYILRVASAPSSTAVTDSLDFQVASLSYKSSSFATSRGNEKIGGTGYCVTYDTESQSRNVLASPLGGDPA